MAFQVVLKPMEEIADNGGQFLVAAATRLVENEGRKISGGMAEPGRDQHGRHAFLEALVGDIDDLVGQLHAQRSVVIAMVMVMVMVMVIVTAIVVVIMVVVMVVLIAHG